MSLHTTLNNKLAACGFIVMGAIALTSCSTEPTRGNKSTSTLADLALSANEQKNVNAVNSLTRGQREAKLAQIYQSILTLEPNANVRAQIQHRMVQLTVEKHEQNETLENKHVLEQLVKQYKTLLATYPDRPENEKIQYQLAKTYDLLGQSKNSILTLEGLLARYPNTQYYVESQFRRAELYYNLQQYPLAFKAYQLVLSADDNEKYQLNSLYMSGWSLFKLNRLDEADQQFIAVLNHVVSEYEQKHEQPLGENTTEFSFKQIDSAKQSLAMDTQRVLSISLSQQQQVKSLVELLTQTKNTLKEHEKKNSIIKFEHILFANLADFLFEKSLKHDAMLTYQGYLVYAPHTLAAARFNLTLINLHKQQNNYAKVKLLKQRFTQFYGLGSLFWQQVTAAAKHEVLTPLTNFSLEHGRALYAKAQIIDDAKARTKAFVETASALKHYLDLITYQNQQTDEKHLAVQEYYLYADANFEAQQYRTAFNTYEELAYDPQLNAYISAYINADKQRLAYQGDDNALPLPYIQKESAYAAIVSLKALLAPYENIELISEVAIKEYAVLLAEKRKVDDLFIQHYSKDKRATLIALKAAERAYKHKNNEDVLHYSQFILSVYGIPTDTLPSTELVKNLNSFALKQVSIASQLIANTRYELQQYKQAEQDYLLALIFVNDTKLKYKQKQKLNDLIASSIYQQGKIAAAINSEQAIHHYLRLGKLVPQSKYRVNAEFDAANLLIADQKWLQAVSVLTAFKQVFNQHQYAQSIPAKLALCYEKLGDWPNAAKQLLVMIKTEKNIDLKREAQYTAAEYYLKAGDVENAIKQFRTYVHQYPKPFAIAQEVRFKMSEFYRETKEPNKQYFWYRKLISFHQSQLKSKKGEDLSRSNYLASYAAFNLGKAHQQTFNYTKLKVPLNKSLKKKQTAMKQAIHYYQLVFEWQLARFVPQANYAIGQLYRRLAQDVMDSERPHDLDELALEEYEFLLEEIAYPFEEKAIEVHQANAERAWQNIYDEWVQKSLAVLAEIEPAKFNKFERLPEVIDVAL